MSIYCERMKETMLGRTTFSHDNIPFVIEYSQLTRFLCPFFETKDISTRNIYLWEQRRYKSKPQSTFQHSHGASILQINFGFVFEI